MMHQTAVAWSPDGTQIVFVSVRDGNQEVYRMNTDSAPSWQASGFQLVFQTSRDGNDDIYRTSSDGTFQTKLTQSLAIGRAPAWEH